MLTAEEIDEWNAPDLSALRAQYAAAARACEQKTSARNLAALLRAARAAEADGAISDDVFLNALACVQDGLDRLARVRPT